MTAPKMKRLTIALPEDVWARLQREAFDTSNVSIGTYVTRLIVKRDAKRQFQRPDRSDYEPNVDHTET